MRQLGTFIMAGILSLTGFSSVYGEIHASQHVALTLKKQSLRASSQDPDNRFRIRATSNHELDAGELRSSILENDTSYDLSVSGAYPDYDPSRLYDWPTRPELQKPLIRDDDEAMCTIRESYFRFMQAQMTPEEREARREEAGQMLAAMYLLFGAWQYSDDIDLMNPTIRNLADTFPEFQTALNQLNELLAQQRAAEAQRLRFSAMMPNPRYRKPVLRSSVFFGHALRESQPSTLSSRPERCEADELHEAGVLGDALHALTPSIDGFVASSPQDN